MRKYILILLLLPTLLSAQKAKVNLEKLGIQSFDGKDYLVQCDTSASGVIQVLLIPSEQLTKDLESEIGSADGALTTMQAQIDTLQGQKKAMQFRKKELERILEEVKKAQRTVSGKAPQVKQDTMPLVEPAKKKKSVRKNRK